MTSTPTTFLASVPSNIAFVKYWGKRDEAKQWPANDSLSMTLSEARTITRARVAESGRDQFIFAGKLLESAHPKALKALQHLAWLRQTLGFKAALHLDTHNTFPADCGIASSASGLGALTLAAIAAWTDSHDLEVLAAKGYDQAYLAALARMGSGSACRSFFGGFVSWQAGAAPEQQEVVPVETHASLLLTDIIVIVSEKAKSIGSTAAHRAAWGSPLFRPRVAGLPERLERLKTALKTGDFTALGHLIEEEALEMHAVMMTGMPAHQYMSEASANFLAWVREQRRQGKLPAYFTMDAGPNVHLICRQQDAPSIAAHISKHFGGYKLIVDPCGSGPSLSATNITMPEARSEKIASASATGALL